MKSKIYLILLMCAVSFSGFAQIGIGTTSPDASAVLDMTSTTQGVLIPRMTTTQREAITTPAIGLQVYDTDTSSIWSYNGASWVNGTGGPGKFIDGASSDIAFYDGRVGIGRNNFADVHKLWVEGSKSTDGVNTPVRVNADYTGTGTNASTTAIAAIASNVNGGTSNFMLANQGIVNNSAAGTTAFGVSSWQRIENLGAMTDASGLLSQVNNFGNITRAYSQNVSVYNDDVSNVIDDARASFLFLSNFGTMNQAHGLYIDYFTFAAASVTDSYAIYISDSFNQGTNDNFAIYSASDADTYLEGNVGVGVSAPQQKVHISGAMRLEPQATAPAGALGDLYAGTDGNLYFHNGTDWQQVSLVP